MGNPLMDHTSIHASGRPTSPVVIRFGTFRLDLRAGLLLRGQEPIALRPKTWSVMQYLAERPGQLVTKRELLDAVWGELEVTEAVLNRSIAELRTALGDSFKTPQVIEPIPRRGFRLIAPVAHPPAVDSPSSPDGGDFRESNHVVATGDLGPSIGEFPPGTAFLGRVDELAQLSTPPP